MSKKVLTVSSLMTIGLTLMISGLALAKELRIAGGAAPMNNIFKPMKEDFEAKTGINLTLLELGPRIAMQELLKGQVDLACAGLSWESWVDLMKKEANIDITKEKLQTVVVGKDLIKVYVNPNNPVNKLTKEQLKGIFTGRIKNWKEVGGNDEPITVVWGTLIPGTNKVFSEAMLDGEKVTEEALLVGDVGDIREAVANLTEAIGIGPISLASDPNLKVVETPEVGRPIICAYRSEASAKLEKLLQFILQKKN